MNRQRKSPGARSTMLTLAFTALLLQAPCALADSFCGPRLMADLNGDGKADIVSFGDEGVWTSLAIGNGNFAPARLVLRNFGRAQGWDPAKHVRLMADLNGDGKADIVAFGDAGVWTALSTGDGRFATEQLVLANFGTAQGWTPAKHVRLMADINGDGKADIVAFGDAGVWTALSAGNGAFAPEQLVLQNFGVAQEWTPAKHVRLMADINGDGKADIVAFGDAGVWTALAAGNGTFAPEQFVLANFGVDQGWDPARHVRLMADINGDGKADIVAFGGAGVWTALSAGNGAFAAEQLVLADFGVDQGWDPAKHVRALADINGDGKADIVAFGAAGVWTAASPGTGGFPTRNFVLADFICGGNYIPATEAFDHSPVCSASDLSNDHDLARANPEWKAVNGLTIDPKNPVLHDKPTILEGFVSPQPANQKSDDQSTSEVSEEDLPWNHFTHDFTIKVVPDPRYEHLLSSWTRFPGATFKNVDSATCANLGGALNGSDCVVPPEQCPNGSLDPVCHHTDMEVEWDNSSLMDENEGFQRIWGAVPEFVWAAVGDRVQVTGRWIFDCGHPGVPAAAAAKDWVKYSTEIHPPRAQVTFRLNHPALDSFPQPRVSAPNFPAPQSYLPVTGTPVALPPSIPNTGPTNVPLTEADVFITGNGGGANDLCMILATSGNDCVFGHTTPVIAVNDRNYVFDIYPPGTDYLRQTDNGNFTITPPVPDASLQWRTVDHSSELPAHTCGGSDTSGCITVAPVFCLIDDSTPPTDPDPDNAPAVCPAAPAHPTRLRVIIPFAGTRANYFAQSILLGWDDVPAPRKTPAVRTFKITLHAFTVVENGESFLHDGDWRVFVNVGGQYRYMSQLFDRNSDGSNPCNGDGLTENGDGDCFLFDGTPWIVSVQDGTPIHVGVGGFESDPIDSDFCRQFPPGGNCDPFSSLVTLAVENDDRIGTYEFDLLPENDYRWNLPGEARSFMTAQTNDGEQYKVEFRVEEIQSGSPPTASLTIGQPSHSGPAGLYISASTPFVLQAPPVVAGGFQYRFHREGRPLPQYPFVPAQPYPVHWEQAHLSPGVTTAQVSIGAVNTGDGAYDFQYSAQSLGNKLEPRHTTTVILDSTPPVITVSQPRQTSYAHGSQLTAAYSARDGNGSGLASVTASLDGVHSVQNGEAIDLSHLTRGPHRFTVRSVDNVGNASTHSVTFRVR